MSWESLLIGTVLNSPTTMMEAEDLLPSDFTGSNQVIWTHMLALFRQGGLDTASLMASLDDNEESVVDPEDNAIVGQDYITKLVSQQTSSVEVCAKNILRASVKRELIRFGALVVSEAKLENCEPEEMLEHAERKLMGIRRMRRGELGASLSDLASVLTDRVTGMRDGTIKPAYVPAITALREKLHFVDDNDYVIFAARPGNGKSSLMRYEFLKYGAPTVIFNFENSPLEYVRFAISYLTRIDSHRIRNPKVLDDVEMEKFRNAVNYISKIKMQIVSIGAPNIADIEKTARWHITQNGARMIGIDYIQLVFNPGAEKRVDDVTLTSGKLRGIAQQYGVPVFAISQMSRDVTKRAGFDPQLNDLRDSGSLEQDGTIIMFPVPVWEDPTVQQLRQFPENLDERGVPLAPLNARAIPIRIRIAKNRNGPTGDTDPILWVKHINDFRSLANFIP